MERQSLKPKIGNQRGAWHACEGHRGKEIRAHELNMNTTMSQKKRLLNGNFVAEIFEPKFNTFMNITTTILEVRFLWGFFRSSCITGKTKLETYEIYNLQADKQLNET